MPTPEQIDPDFGARMRRTREARGISLRQIADTTKLSVGALEALERNDVARLPGGIFSRAFVRAYAEEVGLDPEATVREFLTRFPIESVTTGTPHADDPMDALPGDLWRRANVVAMACVVVAILASAAVYFFPTR